MRREAVAEAGKRQDASRRCLNPIRRRPIITGASSGIGAELARVFARNGHGLVLVARRTDRLETLADEIANGGRRASAGADRRSPDHADAGDVIDEALAAPDLEPQFVVNNAGFGLVGAVASATASERLLD